MPLTRLGYTKRISDLSSNIFVPRYYNPGIARRLEQLARSHDLKTLGELEDEGSLQVLKGHDIGKMFYGGHIPYVRTTDLSTWDLVSNPKQAVDETTLEQYATRQDVQVGDVFFVRDGLYLIGSHAMVTDADLPLIHQSHLIRFRVARGSSIAAPLLLALLSTPIVRRQIRAKQFTAGIIDKIEDRYRELVLPIPRSEEVREALTKECAALVARRVELRETLRRIPAWVEGLIPDLAARVARPALDVIGEGERRGFAQRASSTRSNIFIPKYYDPAIADDLDRLRARFRLVTIADLQADGVLEVGTGLEVGKLAYGLGPVPFVRTSDLADWELRGEPKQRVSEVLYEALKSKVDVRADDVLVVRDGTYLVGTSAIVSASDSPMLYAGGLYKLRSHRPDELDPYLLLALLNMPIVKRQMSAKRFTRDIIDTLGRRLFEIVLPIPKSVTDRQTVADLVRETVHERVALRVRAKELALQLEGPEGLDEEEMELLETDVE